MGFLSSHRSQLKCPLLNDSWRVPSLLHLKSQTTPLLQHSHPGPLSCPPLSLPPSGKLCVFLVTFIVCLLLLDYQPHGDRSLCSVHCCIPNVRDGPGGNSEGLEHLSKEGQEGGEAEGRRKTHGNSQLKVNMGSMLGAEPTEK